MPKPVKEIVECPPCEWCGARTISRGHEMYAKEPHWRRKFTCTSAECGHTFVPKIKAKEILANVTEQST